MPESKAIWGIEIGQAGLKALKLRYSEAAHQVVAVGFDYIPHAKILSQPDAIPDELISEAMTKFLSRNKIEGDLVTVGLPAQTSLARFIQLPPVEAGKVKEIVQYEAKQQIPFPLEEVYWDFQQLGGGSEEGGFILEAEVGIFAMKRDQVLHQLAPLLGNKIEVEMMQISPLALYSYLSYDQLGIGPEGEGGPASDDYTAVLDMGADQSTIMVTNGEKIWIRNIPIGGNHFTRALTKEMKLTFAKAEHLKCNATKSPDPKAVFQALKPVFNDYLSEVQRSLGFFSSVNHDGEVTKVVGCGSGFRMAGLQKFLDQNLDCSVVRAEGFKQLAGKSVLEAPLFRENIMSFTVAYGLALQGMKMSRVNTTLLPPEIALAREIRRKKPWAAMTAALLLVGLTLSTLGYANSWKTVHNDPWDNSLKNSTGLQSKWSGYTSGYSSADGRYNTAKEEGAKLIEGMKGTLWLEFYKSLNECLPRDVDEDLDITDIEQRNRIMVESITAAKTEDLAEWYEAIDIGDKEYSEQIAEANGLEVAEEPEGEGYLFTLTGEHYHHIADKPLTDQGLNYLLNTIIPSLQSWQIEQEDGTKVDVRKLGISHPVVVYNQTKVIPLETLSKRTRSAPRFNVLDKKKPAAGNFETGSPGFESADPGGLGGAPGISGETGGSYDPSGKGGTGNRNVDINNVHRTLFTIQFIWKPTAVEEREAVDPLDASASEVSEEDNADQTDSTESLEQPAEASSQEETGQ
ncbi:MAG: type IV pilus assembly protein PilM [Planctomycetaceae bacterium]|nr:type IV pilus assembly protein PilM [Planctomycetaceae bacterium]